MQLAFGNFLPGVAVRDGVRDHVGGPVSKARAAWLAAVILLAALAAGCGGGGGGAALEVPEPLPPAAPDPPPPAAPDPPPARPADLQALAAPYESDPEYQTAWGLAQIDAATAYARIAGRDGAGTAPGAGARVAVIDTGIDIAHWELEPQRISTSDADAAGNLTPGRSAGSTSPSIPFRRTERR